MDNTFINSDGCTEKNPKSIHEFALLIALTLDDINKYANNTVNIIIPSKESFPIVFVSINNINKVRKNPIP